MQGGECDMHYKHIDIEFLGHASIRIITSKPQRTIIYFDPYKLDNTKPLPKADIIAITHEHYDHLSIEDIKKIVTPETTIITTPDTLSKLASIKAAKTEVVIPGKTVESKGVKFKATAAYNTNKPYHPKDNDWVGYLADIDGVRIYVPGDTDSTDEMQELGVVDIAFLPVSGTYVMNAKQAAAAAKTIKPKYAIPIHYGVIVGEESDAETFKKLLEGSDIEVRLR